MLRTILAGFLGTLLILTDLPLQADEPNGLAAAAALQDLFTRAIESAEQSVVSIARDKVQPPAPPLRLPARGQFPPFRQEPQGIDSPDYIPNEFGAGIVIDDNGLILTNYHLVRGGPIEGRPDEKSDQRLYVRLPDRRGFDAKIFAADPRSDLAVLKIPVNGLRPIRLGNASAVRKGQFAIALGNPYLIARDGSASATWGIISNLTRQAMQDPEVSDLENRRRETIQNLGVLMQIDTRLDLGTSGGALLNLQGELIGITTSLAAVVGYEKSAGFAVPIDDSTRRIIESLRQGKEVEYGFLGIVPRDVPPNEFAIDLAPIAKRHEQYGAARIDEVLTNLPAERFGMRRGDLVLRVGDKRIRSKTDLMREIGMLAPGANVRVLVWRPAEHRDVELSIEVGKWPVMDEEGMIVSTPTRAPWRGVKYDYPSARSRSFKFLNSPERSLGVLILDVEPNSPAALAELHYEDLITHVRGKPVHTPTEFQKAVESETGPVTLQVIPASSPQPIPKAVEIKTR